MNKSWIIGLLFGLIGTSVLAAVIQRESDVKPLDPTGKSRAESPLPRGFHEGQLRTEPQVILDSPDLAALAAEDARRDSEAKPTRLGIVRDLPAPVSVRAGKSIAGWSELQEGGAVWTLVIERSGAVGLRPHLAQIDLPPGCEVLVFDARNPNQTRGPYGADALNGAAGVWLETIFSDRVGVEAYCPPGLDPASVNFTVDRVVDLYRDPLAAAREDNCHNDVTCYPAWATQRNAVAGIGSIDERNYLWCTGCLLNDADPSTYIDYFMTAHHCVGNQTEASSTEFYWFFQTSSCNGTPPSLASVPRTGGGADFLAGRSRAAGSDFAFLRLRSPAPGGVSYAGWTLSSPSVGQSIIGIHHPDGAYKRVSFGQLVSSDTSFWDVRWNSGVTEPGSSGSPLFNSSGYFIGQLWGGSSYCDYMSGIDEYGRMSASYPYISGWLNDPGSPPPDRLAILSDYTGDRKSDLPIYYRGNGAWYIRSLSGAVAAWGNVWGSSTARLVPGDYNNDGRFDLAYFEPSSATWFIKTVEGSILTSQHPWGWSSALPVSGDFNGDGRYDLAVYDTLDGNWFIKSPSGPILAWALQWGNRTSIPVPGDYNGDGQFDLAVFDRATGSWYIRTLGGGVIAWGQRWGWNGARPVPGDYDGDEKFDLAVFDPATGNWYIRSVAGAILAWAQPWGWNTAIPMAGDFNGDGRYDLAVYNSFAGQWFVRSLTGTVLAWGSAWGWSDATLPVVGP